jgi:hypothetical protein
MVARRRLGGRARDRKPAHALDPCARWLGQAAARWMGLPPNPHALVCA